MLLLAEDRDDAHLSEPERTEERLGSVDYDVWSCPSCERVLKLRYGAILTSYSRCPECGFRTKNSTSERLALATTYSRGRERIVETCASCSYRHVYERLVPRVRSSSGRRRSGWGSGSGSSWGSRSGSGWGSRGGRSSGGGASGSW